ncbi:TniQ family protein [Paracoccus sp. DMF-8]|uniref:TniQ family protein n=1 Tax=Paracoccus sp. DMF-8 TaxID=3019445 RepID=UPI0023E8E72C|nr:TniQ family protein [Paracoccus sp. DMF-8]MDF3606666.1 TniQ family protein [Paracoccus sp. DMF-8]
MTQPRPAERETLPSYLSRLAASKGVATPEFAYDLKGSFNRFLNCDPEMIEALSVWARLTPHDTGELLSWTGVRAGNVRLDYRGDTVISRALRNPIVRGCPTCLREDATRAPSEPTSAMVMRGDWQLREVSICLRHHMLLVPLWTEDRPEGRFDMQFQLSLILDRIMSGQLDGAGVEPSSFDLWLDDRLSRRPDQTWLAPHSTSATAAFCRMFGAGLIPEKENPIAHQHAACAAGYDVVKQGPDAIKARLTKMSFEGDGVADGVRQVYHRMLTSLGSHLRDEPAFDVFREILRDAVLDLWPLGAGESVFGHVLPERRIHSVVTAASELSINPGRLRPLLVEAGAIAADDHRPHARVIFDARRFVPLLASISEFVPDGAMRKTLGATETEMMALEQAGILIPRTALTVARLRWHPKDAEALIDELKGYALPCDPTDAKGWVTIQVAQARTGVSVKRIFSGLRDGALRLWQQSPTAGYHGFRVDLADIVAMDDASSAQSDHTLSLSEFGRGIGIRDAAQLLALVEAGDLLAQEIIHPVTRRRMWTVSESSIAAFRARFLNLTMIEQEFGLQRNVSRSILKQRAIQPHLAGKGNFGTLYLRVEVERALQSAGHKKT